MILYLLYSMIISHISYVFSPLISIVFIKGLFNYVNNNVYFLAIYLGFIIKNIKSIKKIDFKTYIKLFIFLIFDVLKLFIYKNNLWITIICFTIYLINCLIIHFKLNFNSYKKIIFISSIFFPISICTYLSNTYNEKNSQIFNTYLLMEYIFLIISLNPLMLLNISITTLIKVIAISLFSFLIFEIRIKKRRNIFITIFLLLIFVYYLLL